MKKVIKALFLFFLFFVAIILIVVSILILNYRKWEKAFESNWNTEYLAESYEEIPTELQAQFFEFVASDEKNNFIELTVSDFSDLLYFAAKNTLQGIDIQNLYVEPEEGVWRIYLDMKLGNFDIPWVSIDLIKDDRETAELYVKNLYLGGMNLTELVPDKWIEGINSGISEALLQFNENLFSKRYIQNIELSSESAIIKGILY